MTAGWVSACGASGCVQVRRVGDTVEVRDSKLGEKSEVVIFDLGGWEYALKALVAGELWPFTALTPLVFSDEECDAFAAWVRRGEFDADRLTAEWKTAHVDSEPPALSYPDTGSHDTPSGVQRDAGAVSATVAADDHPGELPAAVWEAAVKTAREAGYDEPERDPSVWQIAHDAYWSDRHVSPDAEPEDEFPTEMTFDETTGRWGDGRPAADLPDAVRAVMLAAPGVGEPDARQAAVAVLRWLAEHVRENEWRVDRLMFLDNLAALADEIDPKETR